MDDYSPRTPNDFRNFLFLVWKHLRLPKPTEMQYDIAHALQYGTDREMIEAFRGEGKSWITSAFVCWTLDHHPDWNILVVSASKTRADDFSTFVMRLIKEMPILKHLTPKDDQRDSKISFDVGPAPASHAPSVKSLGITSQLTGSRADLIIADDIEVPANSQTQVMRDKLSEQIKEFDAIIKPLATARIVFLGTPQHEQSVYNKLPERGYRVRVWPARCPKQKDLVFYGDKLAPFITMKIAAGTLKEGQPTDPERFTDFDLKKREASYGKTGFALQFMLNTNLSDMEKFPLKVRDLVVMDIQSDIAPEHVVWAGDDDHVINDLPNVAMTGDKYHRPMAYQGSGENGTARWLPYTGCVMAIDPSGRGADELGYAIVKMLNGQLFVVACGGLQGGYVESNLVYLANLAKDHKVNHVIVEENFGDGMFSALLRPVLTKVHPVFIEEVKHSKQKELRIIDTLEPVMNQHKLIIDRKVILKDFESTQDRGTENALKYQLMYQLTRITKERGCLQHDDRLDALAMAVTYWVAQMSKDIETAKDEQKKKALDDELKNFMAHVRGQQPQPTVWAAPRNRR
ncbi:MAG: DNA maturase B [Nitrospira sp. SG-bin2]|uniref:phage terminase large subunit n=1 Tax=Nitrospira cf. moscoviensis SBR1015 TaxID=96242 RepID=UPI000A0D9F50|nr:phage terminase large subunit [Nitrospira cf. moscoviensis SBR1015]OQW34880.1 MAG: DNA maturase B [Nitrospira sp. SG-bin2]